jgi:hypothetical protein
MNLFPEKDETDNSYETEEDQKKDNIDYANHAWVILLFFIALCFI